MNATQMSFHFTSAPHSHKKKFVFIPEFCSWGCPGPTTSHVPASLPGADPSSSLLSLGPFPLHSHGWDSFHCRAAPYREKKPFPFKTKGLGSLQHQGMSQPPVAPQAHRQLHRRLEEHSDKKLPLVLQFPPHPTDRSVALGDFDVVAHQVPGTATKILPLPQEAM